LKKLQAERKKEEERLAQLKAQGEKLKKQNELAKKKQESVQKVNVKSSQDTVTHTKKTGPGVFVKSFDQILKEKKEHDELSENNPKQKKGKEKIPQKKVEKPVLKKTPAKVVKPTPKPTEEKLKESRPANLGIKTLDQILNEKGGVNGDVGLEEKILLKSTSPSLEKQGESTYVDELRKKNQQKFGVSPLSGKIESATIKDLQEKEISPKRRQEVAQVTEPTDQQKRQKIVQSIPKINTQPIKVPASPKLLLKSPSTDDFDKDLADLEMEIGTDSVDVDGDEDFDKEFNELETLMST